MIDKLTAQKRIADLVTRFEDQFDSYKNSNYNETQTRRDFIDPFFKALGWDIDNEEGYAEAYREVINEDKVKVSGATKAPDYSFRLVGGKRLFFVEAKKPSVSVKDDIHPAYQIRRYGWSAKHPISIITDFEEFAIYDCTKKPKPDDKASVARIKYFTYKDYLNEFDFVWETFSKEQVLKGSFDKFIQSDTHKKGTASVDRDFLESLDRWRTYLAVNISWNNKNLNEAEINFAVQQTIDRLIFLRIAEDRSVEPYGNLKHAIKQGNLYSNLFELFRKADDKYNSGLFDQKKDLISENLIIENKIIKTIINELYYPECPYEFSVLPVEILGSAYEQFLGKVIRITPAHHAKIEEKPEVRKAGGVYYTPQYIVDYIVKNTVGNLIEGKTPKEISNITIVDPACGSGSFLIGAYQYLLDWHKNYYSDNGKISKGKKDNPLTPEGQLTTAEKKRILLNNIFGVDVDVNAVEVTKLSLLLKCLEGETEASINQQFKLFNERVLPTLDDNIKDGNSLIDIDLYSSDIDFGFEKKINPFSWKNAFPTIFKKGGFDIVIGNPPYFSLSILDQIQTTYFKSRYKVFEKSSDIYCLFFEKALEILRSNGLISFITSNQWLQTNYGKTLRKFLLVYCNPELLINFGGLKIFQDATVDTSILVLSKSECKNNLKACHFRNDYTKGDSIDEYLNKNAVILHHLNSDRWTIAASTTLDLKRKICHKGKFLKNWNIKIFRGVVTGFNEAFIIDTETKNAICSKFPESQDIIKPLLRGRDVHKYYYEWNSLWLIFTRRGINIDQYPGIKEHLEKYKEKLTPGKGRKPGNYKWYEIQDNTAYYQDFDKPKIIYPETTVRRSEFVFDKNKYYPDKTCFFFTGNDILFLNGVLASKLLEWYLESELRLLGKRSIQYSKQFIEQIPIPVISENNLLISKEITKLVEQVLKLFKKKGEIKLQTQINQVQSNIDYCENRINELVYQLYGLTKEEIHIIEGE
jgi:adenine-specific DNA-methyltransferase